MAEPDKNEPPKNDAQQPEKIRDFPRPFAIFRDEAKKTAAVQKTAIEQRSEVDKKFNGLNETYVPALAEFDKQCMAAAEQRLVVRRESVDKLTKEVGTIENSIAELEKKLAEEREKLFRSQNALKNAESELKDESGKLAKEHRAARKAKAAELNAEIKAARKARREVYAKTGKELRREHWNTFARTTKESIAYFPDMGFRAVKATGRALGEAASVFGRSAKKAQEGFVEPTPFSITRDQPVGPQNKKAPDAPKA